MLREGRHLAIRYLLDVMCIPLYHHKIRDEGPIPRSEAAGEYLVEDRDAGRKELR
jgi:hypothetical protein